MSEGGWRREAGLPVWALVVVVAMAAVLVLSHRQLGWWGVAAAVAATLVPVAALRAYPLLSLGFGVGGGLWAASGIGAAVPLWTVALGVAVFVVSFLVGRREPGLRGAAGVFAAGAVAGVLTGDVWDVAVMLGAAVALPWTLGRSVRQQADLVTIAAESARLRERDRIAHDMHDTLGHELGLLALRAGALEMAADLDQRHRDAAAELRIGAGLATERLAEIVSMLRDGEPAPLDPPVERVEDLVERASRAGMAATLEWDGPRSLPAEVGRVACRVVQEALTNAAKHAPGAAVAVRVATVDSSTTGRACPTRGSPAASTWSRAR